MTDEEAAARTGLPLSEIKRRKVAGQAKIRAEMQSGTRSEGYSAPVKPEVTKATTDALRGGGASFQTERAMKELNL
jgi:hypothetical protein